jgi:hypothetical protein
VHPDAGNLSAFLQADVFPGFTAVSGFPHAVALAGGHAANGRFAGADVNHVIIGFSDRNCSNRADPEILVCKILPGRARVFGFPHPATGCSHVIKHRIVRHARYRGYPAADVRANQAPVQAFELSGILHFRGSCQGRKTDRKSKYRQTDVLRDFNFDSMGFGRHFRALGFGIFNWNAGTL